MWTDELRPLITLMIATVLGACIGYERERDGLSAGIRTYAAVSLGSALFTCLSGFLSSEEGSSRLLAAIISGIGFLGAGIILKNKESQRAHGLTTAATIWCTAGIGVAAGLEKYVLAAAASATIYILLALQKFGWYQRWKESIRKDALDDQDLD